MSIPFFNFFREGGLLRLVLAPVEDFHGFLILGAVDFKILAHRSISFQCRGFLPLCDYIISQGGVNVNTFLKKIRAGLNPALSWRL